MKKSTPETVPMARSSASSSGKKLDTPSPSWVIIADSTEVMPTTATHVSQPRTRRYLVINTTWDQFSGYQKLAGCSSLRGTVKSDPSDVKSVASAMSCQVHSVLINCAECQNTRSSQKSRNTWTKENVVNCLVVDHNFFCNNLHW